VERARETLTPLAAWLLVQVERTPDFDPTQLSETRDIPKDRVVAALAELKARDLLEVRDETGASSPYRLTPNGCDVLDHLVTARRAHLAELVAEWDTGGEQDAEEFLRNAVADLVPETRREGMTV
jgi:DNA-binding MarR family transcriptional regulator